MLADNRFASLLLLLDSNIEASNERCLTRARDCGEQQERKDLPTPHSLQHCMHVRAPVSLSAMPILRPHTHPLQPTLYFVHRFEENLLKC